MGPCEFKQCAIRHMLVDFADRTRSADEIVCTSTGVDSPSPSPAMVEVMIDNEVFSQPGVEFQYRNNPHFTSVEPQFTIPV